MDAATIGLLVSRSAGRSITWAKASETDLKAGNIVCFVCFVLFCMAANPR